MVIRVVGAMTRAVATAIATVLVADATASAVARVVATATATRGFGGVIKPKPSKSPTWKRIWQN
jgi:hypothetical protein